MVTTTTGLATSFIQFTRTSNATVTDSDGRIKWAGHNLLTNSESFDTASYGTVGLLAFGSGSSANSTAAPNGTTTADYIRETNANSRHFIFANPTTIAGANYTARVFVKAAERTFIALGIRTTDGVTGYAAAFNLSTGAMTATSSTGTPTNTSAPTPVAVGSGWYLLSVSMDATTSSAYVEIGLSDSATPTFAAGMPTYTGTGTSGLYLWGAHLYRSDLGGMVLNPAQPAGLGSYYPTTPRNLVGYSEDFGNALWFKTGASVTSDAAIIAPNGLQTADKLVEDGSTGEHRLRQTVNTVGGTRYTLSFYAKAAERNWVALNVVYPAVADNITYFNLTGSGSIGTNDPDNTASITSVGDGWYRCSVTHTTQSAQTSVLFIIYAASANNTISYAGVSGSGVYIWGAQLSDSASLDAYSPVYGAAVTSAAYYAPRLDFDPVTLAANGLLVEEQRTNLLRHTAAPDVSPWSFDTSTGSVITLDGGLGPDGVTQFAVFNEGTSTSAHRVNQSVTSVANTAYTVSAYIKAGTSRYIVFGTANGGVAIDTQNWVVTETITGANTTVANPTITPVSGGIYRVAVTVTHTTTTTVFFIVGTAAGATPGSMAPSFAGTSRTAVFTLCQLEAGSFATSYIPNGSAVAGATRTADVASVSTQAFPYSASEGTVVANVQRIGSSQNTNEFAGVELSTGSFQANSISLQFDYASFNRPYALVFNPSGSLTEVFGAGGSSPNYTSGEAARKIGAAIKSADSVTAINGTAGTTNTSAITMPSPTRLKMSSSTDTALGTFNGYIRQVTYLPRRITNSELQARTV